MNPPPSKPRYGVLYVDDEAKSLRYFQEAFDDEFVIYTAGNAWDGYQLLVEHGHSIGVLLTDQRMPGESGVELMEKAKLLNPNLVRILITAYADYQTAVDAVNAGHAFRYLHKPWDPEELSATIRHALRYYETLNEREDLLKEKETSVRTSLMGDRVAGMGILAEGLNHHVRNALTVIRAFIELAPQKLAEEISGQSPHDSAFWQGWQGQALAQMDRIQTLLSHLSAASHAKRLSRLDCLHLEDVLSQVMDRYAESLTAKGVAVYIDVDKSLPKLVVNQERFLQLWHLILTQNLTDLTNGDSLHIRAVHEPGPHHGGFVTIQVTDNASWPDRERTSNLFDPFFVRNGLPNEFGVNMMACYVIVHLHRGSIEACPVQPKGLELKIRIPVEPPEAVDSEDDFFQRLNEHEEKWRARELDEEPVASSDYAAA